MKLIQKISDIFFSVLLYVAGFLLTVMVLLVFTNVVLRYVFNSGIYWSEEASLIIVIWFTFIAFALGVKEDLHISINILPKKIPSKIISVVGFLKYAVEIFCGGILFVYGIKLTRAGASSVLPATGLSNAVSYLIVPVSAVFVVLFALLHFVKKHKTKKSLNNNSDLQGD
ncbi:TRAP transporter small permease [Treponema sp. OMZ 840]|uniref:TRAP transporter small permease n=1 Tax=Treponema sp. OMZ 840 TaxID=244313 RepID=UPI003D942339